MKRFLVTYLAPASVIAEWKKTDPAQRREAETKMQAQWKKWMADNAKMFVNVGAGVGKTKLVNTRGTSDTKNDIMLYSVVQAESHEAAAEPADVNGRDGSKLVVLWSGTRFLLRKTRHLRVSE